MKEFPSGVRRVASELLLHSVTGLIRVYGLRGFTAAAKKGPSYALKPKEPAARINLR